MSMVRNCLFALCIGAGLTALPARATFHTFVIEQIYSNADGRVQFVVLHESLGMNGQNMLSGRILTAGQAFNSQGFVFPIDLPGGGDTGYGGMQPAPTANRRVLIATPDFAALNIVKPDYIMPSQFLPLSGGFINYAQVDQVSYTSLPTDGVSAITRSGAVIQNLATNFDGQSGSIVQNYQGLWWAGPPPGIESGWGINFAHQGDTIFASWFTYDATGKGLWLVMTALKNAPNAYGGQLFTTTGPPFNAVPFNPANVVGTQVGTGTLTFTGPNDGSFSYTVNGISQVKSITREVFDTPPTCATATGSLAAATNYQDLWWAAPPGSESGWGINLTHQGNIIFATWFTYDTDGSPMWLGAITQLAMTGAYSGAIYRSTGPAFSATPFNPLSVVANPVGNASFTFSDGNNATFAYTLNGVSQQKAITRQIFVNPGTVCQ
jgi:hypothetical protein